MDGKCLIEKIRLRNILSFGDKGEEIRLLPLNIFIGQNASGKSNLIDIFKLLRSLPHDKGLATFISRNGGISEWLWKGKKSVDFVEINIGLDNNRDELISYLLAFGETPQRLKIFHERIEYGTPNKLINREKHIEKSYISNEESVLALASYSGFVEDTDGILNLAFLKIQLLSLAIYSELQTNRSSAIRKPQIPDAPNDFLDEDGSNLALVLNDLQFRGEPKDKVVENLKKFYPQAKDYFIKVGGGTVQLFISEEGLEKPISAMRLSDGTLRYLCLLAILCHPEPPPLICIEEPETGLHPDILPTIAELLIEASNRTQLIVTTHSDILVSALSHIPEAVLVCEKDEEGTHFKRLNKENLKEWLDEYSLGELWLKGEIGGTRW